MFYTSDCQKKGEENMEEILKMYYGDNAKRLHSMVDRILFRLGLAGFVDCEDFYSLANEVFVEVMNRYEESQSFDAFLYSCLCNRFKSELTRRNRQKRQGDAMTVSIDEPIGDEEDSTWKDILADSVSVEQEVLEKREEGYSRRVLLYLERLSGLQRQVLERTIDGYSSEEIRRELHISGKQYSECNAAIHSYRNISVLF